MCWYCCWGLPKEVADIYQFALKQLDGDSHPLEYGPAHIVWADYNFEDRNIQWCLDNFEQYRGENSDADLAVVRQSLENLLTVPEDVRCCAPDHLDASDNPMKYPPHPRLGMVKV